MFVNKIKKNAIRCDDNPGGVIGSALQSIPSPVAARLPKINTLTREVQRYRKAKQFSIPTALSLEDLIIPNDLTKNAKGYEMLLHDSGANRSRFIIFATKQNLDILADCKQWAGDGTFSSVPSIFKQLYTIHGMVKGKLLPLVYILMPDKNEESYSNVLSVLKNYLPHSNVERMMVDFEIAFINAFKLCFPNVHIAGCYFHFTQCVWRHVQCVGLQRSYNNDVNFALNVRMLMALAFVPVHDVKNAFNQLIACKFYEDNEVVLDPLISYFEHNWIGVVTRNRNRRLKPFFSLDLWNCNQAVLENLMRTNNSLEGWHNSFNNKVRVSHASMSKFITVIKYEQALTETIISQLNTGLNITAKRRKTYKDIDCRLESCVSKYDPNNILQYLHNIACILSI